MSKYFICKDNLTFNTIVISVEGNGCDYSLIFTIQTQDNNIDNNIDYINIHYELSNNNIKYNLTNTITKYDTFMMYLLDSTQNQYNYFQVNSHLINKISKYFKYFEKINDTTYRLSYTIRAIDKIGKVLYYTPEKYLVNS